MTKYLKIGLRIPPEARDLPVRRPSAKVDFEKDTPPTKKTCVWGNGKTFICCENGDLFDVSSLFVCVGSSSVL